MQPGTERDLATEMRRVFEGIGRCLLIYQRIEISLKYLLPHVAGPESAQGDTLAHWRSLLDSKETLGPLMKRLGKLAKSSDPIEFERHLGELVEQRNDLVHHFSRLPFAGFRSLEECDAALAHLNARLEFALPLEEALERMLKQFRDALLEDKLRAKER